MTSRQLLDRNELYNLRAKTRIFGNIDSDWEPLSTSRIVELVWQDMNMSERLKKAFERDDVFYRHLIK